MEIIEEQWRNESAELVSAISRLQEENKRLQKEREGADIDESGNSNNSVTNNCDDQFWRRMGETNEQHRAALREKEVLLEDKETIIEGVLYINNFLIYYKL